MSDIQGKKCSTAFLYFRWENFIASRVSLVRVVVTLWCVGIQEWIDHELYDRFLCSYTHCSVRFNRFRMFHIICQQFEHVKNTNFVNTCSSMEV